MPTVMICTDEFSLLGRHEAEGLGMPALPIALVPHPLGGQPSGAIIRKAETALEQVAGLLTMPVSALPGRALGKG